MTLKDSSNKYKIRNCILKIEDFYLLFANRCFRLRYFSARIIVSKRPSGVKSIEDGAPWNETIAENIKTCDIFIIILTNFSVKSSEVEEEVLLAKEENKRIIPCTFEEVDPMNIKWDLRKIQGPTFRDTYDLVRKVKISQDRQKALERVERTKS